MTFSSLSRFINVLIVSMTLTALHGAFALAEGTEVATVGSKKITLEDFNRRYEEMKSRAVNAPSKKIFLEDLIRYEMGVQEAEKRKLDKDPVIAERMRQELYKGLVEKDLADKVNAITVSEDEMRDYYKVAPEIRSSHILIELKPGSKPAEKAAARKRAEEIYSEVKKSKRPFEELVNLYTDDISTKKAGGDVGWQTKLSVVPAFYEALLKLKVGEISPLVETAYGFHIIKLTGKKTFEQAEKRPVRGAVFEKKRLALFNTYFDKLKKTYKITTNAEALEK